ncbi:MAG: TIGR03960 family B12-binding radical SAM protein, partial [Clostridiaceae bacterium]|nr:TIGR03960 family B12-binding radical SAM protein [Clostridiaceae bacterium]
MIINNKSNLDGIAPFIDKVEKPSRYLGGEWGSVQKDIAKVDIRFAFCFPDIYEVGMSHLGLKILYGLINERPDTYCERVFAPWVDMEEHMRNNNVPLFSVETHDELKSFDIAGFTLQYEMSYTNIVNMLNLAGIPIHSSERINEHPFVCAGGPCAYNPEPLADIVDFFVLGEGEEVLNEVMDAYVDWKQKGVAREDFLNKIVNIEGIYIPQFYDVKYNLDGTVHEITPKSSNYPQRIRKRITRDLDKTFFPEKIIVPYMDIVHNRIMLELFRGCIRGCRFCQAGVIYRPGRERSADRLLEHAKKLEACTGYEEKSLTSLSTSDYTE